MCVCDIILIIFNQKISLILRVLILCKSEVSFGYASKCKDAINRSICVQMINCVEYNLSALIDIQLKKIPSTFPFVTVCDILGTQQWHGML